MPVDQQKKLEKKRRIIESAYALFRDKNIYNTAVDDIVKAAGIARGTFYLYFKDKSDLIEQLIFLKSGESMKEMIRQDIESYARVFLDALIDFMVERRELLTVVNKNMSACLTSFPHFNDEDAEALYHSVTDRFLEEGYTQATLDRTAYIVFEMIDAVAYDAITYKKPFGLEDLRPMLIDAALSVIRGGAAAGREKTE